MERQIQQQFQTNFQIINEKFSHYFRQLFAGGQAELILQFSDPLDDESEGSSDDKKVKETVAGIEILATPPGKRLKNISVLSGGEKAMTAIALICAILASNPSPFVFLDEVDAALDEANAGRFAAILQELSAQTQFIVITHNHVTMHTASILYGVTMNEGGISSLVGLDVAHAERLLDKKTETT